jgi:multidrug resistance protein MdtO
LLQTEAPATDLTVLRDRVVGIVLGNVVITLIFSTLWPESATTRLRVALAEVLRAVAALLRSPAQRPANRRRTLGALAQADEFESLSQFELAMLPGQVHLPALSSVERVAAAAFIVTSDPLAHEVEASTASTLADWLDAAGRATAEASAPPPLPAFVPMSGTATSKLYTEIERVAATAH